MAATGDLRAHTRTYLALYLVVAVGYLLVAWGRRSLRLPVVLLVAAVLRILLLPGVPSLSDDFHRYIWDGRVQEAGLNPYRYAPGDAALDEIPYADRGSINHPQTRTIYPPLSQLLFYGAARAGLDSVLGFKLLFGLMDVGTAALIAVAAGPRRRSEALTLYLLHPLVLQETWSSAHLEILPVLFSLAALVLILRRRDVAAGVAVGLGTAAKLTPAFLLVPALVGRRARPLPFLLGFAPAAALPFVPYLLGAVTVGSLEDTGARPRFNASFFQLLEVALPYEGARVAALALFLVGSAVLAWALPGRDRTAIAFAGTATLALLLLPVVHPWYWLAPLALAAAAGAATPLVLGLLAPVTYASRLGVPFGRLGWGVLLTYLPALPAVVHDVMTYTSRHDAPAAQSSAADGRGP